MNEPSELRVNLSETDDQLVLHAPMPGAEPEDIVITLAKGNITIKCTPRGTLQEGAKRHLHEWQIGAYERTVSLPKEVTSERVNVTYKNGVLTVTMPIGTKTMPRDIQLTKVGSAHGEEVGHRGRVTA